MRQARPVHNVKLAWLARRSPAATILANVETGLRKHRLHTICEEGLCPNRGECFSVGTATLLILGRTCTRNCSFYSVATGVPEAIDPIDQARVTRLVWHQADYDRPVELLRKSASSRQVTASLGIILGLGEVGFKQYRLLALGKGFRGVASIPVVHSSYLAEQLYGGGGWVSSSHADGGPRAS